MTTPRSDPIMVPPDRRGHRPTEWLRGEMAGGQGQCIGHVGRAGRFVQAEHRGHHPLDLLLGRASVADQRLLHLVGGVLGHLQPDSAAATRATPAACPVAMAVRALTWKNTRSTTTDSG